MPLCRWCEWWRLSLAAADSAVCLPVFASCPPSRGLLCGVVGCVILACKAVRVLLLLRVRWVGIKVSFITEKRKITISVQSDFLSLASLYGVTHCCAASPNSAGSPNHVLPASHSPATPQPGLHIDEEPVFALLAGRRREGVGETW
ncbi:hypothetical protein E2C01_028832 [Portunus trituberculatus]|uniref:Uncharacterized protein n=1 Tax=Portunus trituberculatus TaxID=210409 RepID=A0A5B7ELI0_PORTR|nr:hypothetical protein [Portunus trituberculatus]